MPNKLNLVRYNVLGAKEADYYLHIDAETASPPKACLAFCSENIFIWYILMRYDIWHF
jgi:hypothetical protein